MPKFLESIGIRKRETAYEGRRFAGITPEGKVVVEDIRGRKRAEFPVVEKAETMGDDPLAIYKPTGAKHVDAAKAMSNFTGWTYASVNAIAMEAAGIQWRLFQVSGKEHAELDDHELLTILDTVNDHMTGIEFKYTILAHLELTGNCYILLEGVKNEMDKPKALHPLNPGHVRVKLDKSTYPYKLSHYEFTVDGRVFTYQPYEILHLKYPDPNDPFVGIGVPQTIPVWIDSDNYAMEYNRKYFLNGAGVGLYLVTQTNMEGNIDRIRRSFADKYTGNENAHKVPVLPKGVDLKHTGVTHRDMDFKDLADATRDRILAAFRVSKTILGTAESDTNRATAETADYVFSKRTMKPKMLLVISYFNEFFVPRYGDNLYLTFIDPVPEDKEFRTKEMQAATGNMPVMTQNEARKIFMGLGPIEGGDKLYVPSTMEAGGQTDNPQGEDATPNLARTAEGWRAKTMRIRTGSKTTFSATYQAKSAMRKAFDEALDKKMQEVPNVKGIGELTKDEYMEYYKRFDESASDAEKKLKSIFKDINEKQKEEVLDNLLAYYEARKTFKANQPELFNVEDWMQITVDLATPILETLTKDESTAAFAMIGVDHQNILSNEGVRNALSDGIQKMAKSYNKTTLEQLTKVLGEKMTQATGTNMEELRNAVDDVYNFADERRAGLIAKTEAYRTANFANRQAWTQSGVVKSLTWYTAEDEKVCPACSELDGTEVGITEKFFNDTYSDGMNPPLHPDCRCYIRPEVISIE